MTTVLVATSIICYVSAPAGQPGYAVRYQVGAGHPIVLLIAAGIVFGCMLVLQIGVGDYYSPERAFFLARLREKAGEGIGVHYYLAAPLVPAMIVAGGLPDSGT